MKKTLRSTINGENRVYDTDDERWPFYIETPRGGFHSNELIGALAIADVGGNLPALKVKLQPIDEDTYRCGPWLIDRQPTGGYRIQHTETGEMARPGFSLASVRCWLADEGGKEVAQA